MRKDENGYIVVETIGTFIPFVILVISILSLVNIVTLQARIHYALAQTANTISMYSYVLDITGVADDLVNLDNKASTVTMESDKLKTSINEVIEGIRTLSVDDTLNSAESGASQVIGWGESIANDPKAALQLMMQYGLNEGRNALFEKLLRPLMGWYLRNGEQNGDEYLKSVNVINGLDGLDFYDFSLLDLESTGANDSTLIDKDENIKIVVHYSIEYKLGALSLPFKPKLDVSHTVKTKAWLNGKGDGYHE